MDTNKTNQLKGIATGSMNGNKPNPLKEVFRSGPMSLGPMRVGPQSPGPMSPRSPFCATRTTSMATSSSLSSTNRSKNADTLEGYPLFSGRCRFFQTDHSSGNPSSESPSIEARSDLSLQPFPKPLVGDGYNSPTESDACEKGSGNTSSSGRASSSDESGAFEPATLTESLKQGAFPAWIANERSGEPRPTPRFTKKDGCFFTFPEKPLDTAAENLGGNTKAELSCDQKQEKEIRGLFSKLLSILVDPGVGSQQFEGYVSWPQAVNAIWLWMAHINRLADVQELMQDLSRLFGDVIKDKRPLSTAPTVGDCVIGMFQGEYYRAMVQTVQDKNVVIFYVDFGNREEVAFETLFAAPVFLGHFPSPAVRCKLHGIDYGFNFNTPAETDDHQKLFVDLMYSDPDVILQGEILGFSQGFTEVCLQGGKWKRDYGAELLKRGFPSTLLTALPGRHGKDIMAVGRHRFTLAGVSSPSVAFFWPEEMEVVQPNLRRIQKLLQEKFDNLHVNLYTIPEPHALVAVCTNKAQWMRAQVMQVHHDETATVRFLDYGHYEDIVNFEQLRLLSAEDLALPIQAVKCDVTDVGRMLNESDKLMALNLLKTSLNQEFSVHVTRFAKVGDLTDNNGAAVTEDFAEIAIDLPDGTDYAATLVEMIRKSYESATGESSKTKPLPRSIKHTSE